MADNVIDFKQMIKRPERIAAAKWAYTTRRVDRQASYGLTKRDGVPRAGDLVLARVTRLGQHKRLELPDGRRARLFIDDEVVVAYGNRYAPDQFEAIVPDNLGSCHLVAAGGIAAQMVFKHDAVKNPTKLSPIGLVTDGQGRVVNLRDFSLAPVQTIANRPPVIAVVGSSMNAGKTTTAANLIRGLTQAGLSVSAGKVTGTGAGGDIWFFKDAGARRAMDFLDTGLPSTYLLSAEQVQHSFITLLGHLCSAETDVVVLEIADGLFQAETAELVTSSTFKQYVDGVLYAASDSLGGAHGVSRLQDWGVTVFAVSGVLTRSPLGMREFQDVQDIPVLAADALQSPVIETHLCQWLNHTTIALATEGSQR